MGAESKRPRIAVTHDAEYNVDPYLRAVELAGGDPVAVTADSGVRLAEFDGLLISGGVDVNPSLYGEAPHPKTEEPDNARDRFEQQMLGEALERDVPVLAVCRGFQLFNVMHGGTLQQHIEGHERPEGQGKAEPAHDVKVKGASRLRELLGTNDAAVNSRHHQAVGKIGEGLAVTATAEDGTVEGLERADRHFAVAVQWHPENMAETDAAQRRLFEGFIEAARAADC